MSQEGPKPRRRGGRPRTDAYIEMWVRNRTLEGLAPVQIHRALVELKKKNKVGSVPSLRTVRRIAAKLRTRDDSGLWSWAEADGEEAALVLPVLGAVMERTEGRVTGFTKDQTDWVLKVRRAALDMPPWSVWETAVAYQVAVQKGTEADRASLDALLAFAPWHSLQASARFREWASRAHPDWFSVSRFILVPAGKSPDEIARDLKPMGNVAGLVVAAQINTDLLRAEVERANLLRMVRAQEERLKAEALREGAAEEEEERHESPREP